MLNRFCAVSGILITAICGYVAAPAHAQNADALPKGFVEVKFPPGKLPEGVIHLKLPPGEFCVEDIERDGKILFRITAGKIVIETKSYYIGDGNGAALEQAPGMRLNNKIINEPGSTLFYEGFIPVSELKAGSLYVTTPSVSVRWFRNVRKGKN